MIAITDISALARWAEPGLAHRLGGPAGIVRDWSTSLGDVRDEAILRAARIEATPERPLHVLVVLGLIDRKIS